MSPNLVGSSVLATAAEPLELSSTPQAYNRYQTPSKSIPQTPNQKRYKLDIVWRNVAIFIVLHILAVIAIWQAATKAYGRTVIFAYTCAYISGWGITAGAHRLWTHRTYKAKLPLRILLAFLQTVCLQNDIHEWTRDHRLHHKFTDTDADPHNATRGFFFSHMGWLMVKKHKEIFVKGKTLDMSDLEADPVVMFQKKYYVILAPVCCFMVFPFIPWYFWGETLWNSFLIVGVLRYILTLHFTWLVNSAAHIYGNKPYDKALNPSENRLVSFLALGEGWHNYHHVFPWDYKTSELGDYSLNTTTAFLDLMAKIGWAYDLKTVSPEMVKRRVLKTGDGSWTDHHLSEHPATDKNVEMENNEY